MQFMFVIPQPANFHLAAVKFSFADNAKALVIERSPSSKSIFGTQDRQAVIEFEMHDHNAKAICSLHRKHNRGGG
ncbi:MAG: hypothetical protein DMF24_11995 [Verrucomicrobia bacterium]|nr:MAG: hypothetical protein DME90_06455 [Verrucomicrobiota bacterium]PYL59851.1 MAG: hypothetical protein DMF24_11995 [Verrucomicrobiota bacterium]